MDSNITLNFYSLKEEFTLQLPEKTTIKEMVSIYEKKKSILPYLLGKYIFLIYDGVILDLNSKDKIVKRFKNNDTIFIINKDEDVTIDKIIDERKNKQNNNIPKNDNNIIDNKNKNDNNNNINNINNFNIDKKNDNLPKDDDNIIDNKIINNNNNIIIDNKNNIDNKNDDKKSDDKKSDDKKNDDKNNVDNKNDDKKSDDNKNDDKNQPISNSPNINIKNDIKEEIKILEINDYLLIQLVNQGLREKAFIEKDIKIFPDKYLSIDDCLNDKDEHFFILGILGKYLKKIGISVLIERFVNYQNKDAKIYNKYLLQLICNNYLFKYKYILDFELKKERIKELLNEDIEQFTFNEKLKKIMIQTYDLKEEEFILSNYKKYNDEYTVLIIFKSNFNKDITKEELLNIFKNDKDLNTLKNIEKQLLIPSIILSKSLLEPIADNKNDLYWAKNDKRGGEDYFPPIGWIKYGLKVFNFYDNKNNNWINNPDKSGQWCIAYCGFTGIKIKIEQKYENDNDIRNPGKKVGLGVYCSPSPKIFEENTEIIDANGINFKAGFMIRINPERIRCPETNKDIWIVNGNDDEIRPYGILIKKV